MEGAPGDTAVKEPTVDAGDDALAVIANGVNGSYDSDEVNEVNKNAVDDPPKDDHIQELDSDIEEMEQDVVSDSGEGKDDDGAEEEMEREDAEVEDDQEQDREEEKDDEAPSDNERHGEEKPDNEVEAMEVDQQSHTSEVECLDNGPSDCEDIAAEPKSGDEGESRLKDDEYDSDSKSVKATNQVIDLNESIEVLDDSSPLKIVEENGSCGSPEVEEIMSDERLTSNTGSPNATKDGTPKKKARKQIDLSNITPRRSSRNIKRTSYIEKEPEEDEAPSRPVRHDVDDSSDIEEIKPEDPLAVDNKDKENSKYKLTKNNKTTIVVNDTKRLVEIAAGTKNVTKGGKKEPTLVIIDTNSIMSGRGGIPVSSSSMPKSQPTLTPNPFAMMPVGTTQTIYSNMRTTITPVPMSSKAAQSSIQAQAQAQLGSKTTMTPVPPPPTSILPNPILPTLTDDMFVVEAPSFIVPYVYEKPPIKSLREFVTTLDQCIQKRKEEDRKREEAEEAEEKDNEGDEDKKSEPDASDPKPDPTEKIEEPLRPKTIGNTYFDLPLGKFFMSIGMSLVEEYVQTDLLRTQKRKQGKGTPSAETQHAISSLIKNLEFSKENNEPFHFDMKKCDFCSFKTESALAMQHHLETPHMHNYAFSCNFCPLEVRSPHDILFHMEAEHNTRGRLERSLAYHQCPNCPFEDNQKGKLSRHIITCTKKFRPECNCEPSSDWEPPAKIPSFAAFRLNRQRSMGPMGPTNPALAAMAMAKSQPPLLPKLLPAPVPGRGRGRPPMQPRFTDLKTMRGGITPMRQDNVGMMYRPSSSGVVLTAPPYSFAGNQMFQNSPAASSKSPAAKLLSQPSISITPLPRTATSAPVSGQGSSAKPGGKNAFVICEICDGYIKDLEQLRNHMQWIHKVKIHPKMIYNRPPLNCQKCQFRFFTDQGLERHLLGSHGLVTSSMQDAANKGKDSGRCPACGRVYQWKLLNHVARDHGMTLKPAHLSYKCTVCTATFGMYKQFENHVYSAHSVVAKRVMDKKSTPSSPSSRSGDSLLKPLKINDEITIIPQPAKAGSRTTSGPQGRPGK